MCRNKDHGRGRCPSDTSEARRLRRKASTARTEHSPLISVKGGLVEPSAELKTFDDIKAEATEVSKLLSAPVNPDPEVQKQIDAANELRVTRLGLAMGEEAERRIGFDRDAILEAATTPGESLLAARKEVEDAGNNYKKLMSEYTGFVKTDAYLAKEELAVAEEERMRNAILDAHQRNLRAKKDLPLAEEADKEARKQIPIEAAEKLAETYRSMIAEIRPVGGEIQAHKFTDPAAQKLLSETAGAHYPSEWISQAGEVAMQTTPEGRASYNGRKPHKDENSEGAPEYHQSFVKEEDLAKYREAFGDDPSYHDDVPLIEDPQHGKRKVISFVNRIPLDPKKDAVDAEGNPLGEGWKKGYVVDKEKQISADQVWYRPEITKGITRVPTVTVPTARSDKDNRASAYHEFGHRLEQTVGNGVIIRLENSFDERRTTDENGVREPLVRVFPNVKGNNELTRRDGYMLPYIGKQYESGYQREIFTVGVEAMFSGKYGAFTGIPDFKGDIYREDKDHRAFMLGTLATA